MLSAGILDYLRAENAEELAENIFSGMLLEEPEKGRIPQGAVLGASSSIAFKITKYLNQKCLNQGLTADYSCINISRALNKNLEKYNKLPFILEISGSVYLNGYLSPQGREKLFHIFLNAEEKVFFNLTSLTFPEMEKSEMFHLKEVQINWKEILDRLRTTDDPSKKIFYEECKKGEKISFEQKLMLLSALSDKELDLRVYLQGLAGKQNVPWYFAKFLKDCANYLSFLEKKLSSDFVQGNTNEENFRLPQYLQSSANNFLSLRKVFYESIRYSKPEKLVASLHCLIRDFYNLYNRPDFRNLQSQDFPKGEILSMKLYLEKLLSSLRHVFFILEQ